MKKRLLALVLCVSLAAVSVTGCGEKKEEAPAAAENTEAEAPAEEAEAEEAEAEEAVEEEVEEVEEAEAEEADEEEIADGIDASEIADISDSLAGTVWLDDGLTTYGFEEDGETLYVVPQGSDVQYEGTYALEATTDGLVGLTLIVPELDTEIDALLTDFTDEALEFTDINTGETAVFVPVADVNE